MSAMDEPALAHDRFNNALRRGDLLASVEVPVPLCRVCGQAFPSWRADGYAIELEWLFPRPGELRVFRLLIDSIPQTKWVRWMGPAFAWDFGGEAAAKITPRVDLYGSITRGEGGRP